MELTPLAQFDLSSLHLSYKPSLTRSKRGPRDSPGSVALTNFAQRRLSRCDCPAISGGLLYEPRSVSQRSCEDAAQRSMGQDLSGTGTAGYTLPAGFFVLWHHDGIANMKEQRRSECVVETVAEDPSRPDGNRHVLGLRRQTYRQTWQTWNTTRHDVDPARAGRSRARRSHARKRVRMGHGHRNQQRAHTLINAVFYCHAIGMASPASS